MADTGTTTDKEATAATPPYVSYKTFKTLLADLKEHGVPSRIDRSVLTRFAGSVGTQLITALRFLKLIDAANVPTTIMRGLVEKYNTPAFKPELATVLRRAYDPIFKLDLQNATSGQFNEQFRRSYTGADAVLRKCITFFQHAVQEADIPVSAYLLKGTKPRSTNGNRRPPRTKKAKAANAKTGSQPGATPPPAAVKPSQVIFDNIGADMTPEEFEAAWTLIKYFKAKDE